MGLDGELLYEFDAKSLTDQPVTSSAHGPVLADFDGDGRLDAFFVIGSTKPRHGMAVCLKGFAGTGPGWYMLRHDIRNTGNLATPLNDALRQNLAGAKRRPGK